MALPIKTATIIGLAYDRARRQYEQHGILNHKVGVNKISAARIDTIHIENKAMLEGIRKPKQSQYAIYDTLTHKLILNQNFEERRLILIAATLINGQPDEKVNNMLRNPTAFGSWKSHADRARRIYSYNALTFGDKLLIKVSPNLLDASGMIATEEPINSGAEEPPSLTHISSNSLATSDMIATKEKKDDGSKSFAFEMLESMRGMLSPVKLPKPPPPPSPKS